MTRARTLVNFVTAMCAFAAVLATAGDGAATDRRVTRLDDRGPGTLREAIEKAAAGDVVRIEVAGVIRLTTGELQLPRAISIEGPGAATTAISAEESSRVFNLPVHEPAP